MKKALKNVVYLLTICLVIFVAGYFVFSFTQFNDKGVKQEYFSKSFYRTRNNDGFISFGNFNNSVICVNDIYYFIKEVSYEDGIFTMSNRDNEEVYYVGVVEKDILFSSSFNKYFYNNTLFQE